MPVDKKVATELGDAVGAFVNKWARENCPGGRMPGNEILSMLLTHAGKLIAQQPDIDQRVALVSQAVGVLISSSDAPVIASVCPVGDVANDALRHAPVVGRA